MQITKKTSAIAIVCFFVFFIGCFVGFYFGGHFGKANVLIEEIRRSQSDQSFKRREFAFVSAIWSVCELHQIGVSNTLDWVHGIFGKPDETWNTDQTIFDRYRFAVGSENKSGSIVFSYKNHIMVGAYFSRAEDTRPLVSP